MAAEQGGFIDVHLHALSAQYSMDEQLGMPRQDFQVDLEMLEKTIMYMNKAGIAQGIISGSDIVMAEWTERYPGRFVPIWLPQLYSYESERESAQFAEAIENHCVYGLGEVLLPYIAPIDDKRLFPLYRICQERQLPVFFHTGLNGPNATRNGGQFRVRMSDPLLLEDVVAAFPDLKMVMCHMGYPFTEQATYMLYAHANVYMDISVVNWILGRVGFHRLLEQVVGTVGSDKILFGSDQMKLPDKIPVAVEAIQEASFLSEEEKLKILRENALRFLDR